jgi:hypothetical protein
MNHEIVKQLNNFIEYVDVKRLNKNSRAVILAYIKWEMEEGLQDFVHEHLQDLELFFECLDAIEEIQEKQNK